MIDVSLASWIALASGCIMLPVLAIMAFRTWRIWRRVDQTQDAASALIDTHVDKLQQRVEQTTALVHASTAQGAELSDDVAQLSANVRALHWVLTRVGAEKTRLQRTLLDMILPTDTSRKHDET